MQKTILQLQRARHELAQSNLNAELMQMVRISSFVQNSDLCQCLHIINELIERVSTLTGEAGSLEDQAHKIQKELVSVNMECWGGD
jgi:hypothetical protein